MKRERRDAGEMKEKKKRKREKNGRGRENGGKRMRGGRGRQHAFPPFIYTRRGHGAAAAAAAAISSIFRFSPFPGSLPSSAKPPSSALAAATPGETGSLTVVLSDRA